MLQREKKKKEKKSKIKMGKKCLKDFVILFYLDASLNNLNFFSLIFIRQPIRKDK